MKKFIRFFIYFTAFLPLIVIPKLPFPHIASKVLVFRLIVLIIALPTLYYEHKSKRPWHYHWPLLLFLSAITFASFLGANFYHSFWSNWQRYNGIAELCYLSIFYLALINTMDKIHWQKWATLSMICSTIVSLDAIGHWSIIHYYHINYTGFYVATLGNPIYLGGYLTIGLTLLLNAFKSLNGRLKRGLILIPIILHILGLLIAGSRGASLAGLVLITLFVFKPIKRTLSHGKVNFILAGSFMVVLWLLIAHYNQRFTLPRMMSDSRLTFWRIAFEGWLKHPFTGWGLDNFGFVYQEIGRNRLAGVEGYPDRVHNTYLEWLTCTGVLGFAAYMNLVWRIGGRLKDVLLYGFIAYLIYNFFVFDILITYIYFFSMLAYSQSDSYQKFSLSQKPVTTP